MIVHIIYTYVYISTVRKNHIYEIYVYIYIHPYLSLYTCVYVREIDTFVITIVMIRNIVLTVMIGLVVPCYYDYEDY